MHEAFANEICEVVYCIFATSNRCYVQFRNPSDASDAVRDLQGASISGQAIEIRQCSKLETSLEIMTPVMLSLSALGL